MTQTTGGFSATDAKVEISANGSTFTDISGWSNKIEPDESVLETGFVWTHEGNYAIITDGKFNPINVRVQIVATEGTGDPFAVLRAAHAAKTPYYVRWSPKGGSAGEYQYLAVGKIKNFKDPGSDVEDAKPVVISFVIQTPSITQSAVAT